MFTVLRLYFKMYAFISTFGSFEFTFQEYLPFPEIVIFGQNQNPLVGGRRGIASGGLSLPKIVIFYQNQNTLVGGEGRDSYWRSFTPKISDI